MKIKCDTCINSRRIISENDIHYNCIFSSRKVTKCLMNNYCYYNTIKINKNDNVKIIDITGVEFNKKIGI